MSEPVGVLNSVAPYAMTLLGWVITALLGLAFLFVVALPAFWLLPLIRQGRASLSLTLERLRVQHTQTGRHRTVESDETARRLAASLRGHEPADLALAGVAASLDRATQALNRSTRRFERAMSPLPTLSARMLALTNGAMALRPRTADTSTITVPDPNDAYDDEGKYRQSRFTLVVASLMLLGLSVINTGMLGEILAALEWVPRGYRMLGVPLNRLFAFIVTLMEATFGFVFLWSLTRSGLGWMFLGAASALFGLGAAVVEASWYAQLAPDSTVAFRIGTTSILYDQVFALFGFLLVAALFIVGLMFHSSLHGIIDASGVRGLRKQVRRLDRTNQRRLDNLGKTDVVIGRLERKLTDGKTKLDAVAGHVEDIQERISEVAGSRKGWDQIRALADLGDRSGDVGSPQLTGMALTFAAWVVLAIASAYAGVAAMVYALQSAFPALTGTTAPMIALGLLLAFFTSGWLFQANERLIVENERLLILSTVWTRRLAIGLFASVLLLYFVLIGISGGSGVAAVAWLGGLFAGLVLIVAGAQLAPRLSMLRVVMMWVRNALAALVEVGARAGLRVLLAVTIVLEVALAMIAVPIARLRRKSSVDVADRWSRRPPAAV